MLLALALTLAYAQPAPEAPVPTPSAPTAAPSSEAIGQILQTIDARQANAGDSKSRVYIERTSRSGTELVYEAVVYRRDRDDKFAILFLAPAVEAGKGYLRIDQNLFLYDPVAGRWERRTERERIGGTDGLRADFAASHLAEDYTAAWVGEELLGKISAWHLTLTHKPGAQVAWPTVDLWVDKSTQTLLKRQDFAESGRLVRTTWYPSWRKVRSEAGGPDVYFPHEIRIKDEVEVGNLTTIVIEEVDLRPLADTVFTKAWIEAKAR